VSESTRRLAAIMFTDMVGYSALAQADEAAALALLETHNRVIRDVFPRFQGREIKTVGDAFLVEFGSALDAARCALEIQRILHEHNASAPPGQQIRIRIGLHVGDVVETKDDLLGDAVNIASRIEPLAQPGGICLTQQAYDQIQNKVQTPVTRLPPTPLKNISVPTAVYRFVQPWEALGADHVLPKRGGTRSIAVLPFTNISPDPKDEYFADGLTEEVITVLSGVHDLSVIARTSVMPYKTVPKSVAQVGQELGVDTVLEGSVRKAGDRIRITLQLVDVATQRHIWASSYNREIGDVFAVQSDIAERTAEALRLELSKWEEAGIRRRPGPNRDAYEAYLHGLVLAQKPGGRGLDTAFESFEKATQLDPNFADAYAAWANLYVVASGTYLPMRAVMPKARKLAARALEINPDSSDAHAALGNIALQFDMDWQVAEAEFGRAIALNPSNITAHSFLGLLQTALGRLDEARETALRVTRLDPGGGHFNQLAWIELLLGNFESALRYAEEARDRDPSSDSGRNYLGLLYVEAGRMADARREAETPLRSTDPVDEFDRAILNALVGRIAEAREMAARVERGAFKAYISAADLSMLYSALGEKEKALALLEKDWREGDRILWLFYRGVFYNPIRDEPRFRALLQQYRLPAAPSTPPSAHSGR